LPFAEDGCGNLYCIDLDPAEHGTAGQVISWDRDSGPGGPVRPSIEDYLRGYLDRVRAGEFNFNAATGFPYGG
jgi:cell wall assembly regulator SMI1